LTPAGVTMYYIVTMLLRSYAVHSQPLPAPISSRILGILCDPYLGVGRVIGKGEPESEPELLIEKAWLTEAKKPTLSNSLKTKGRVLARFFIEKRT
jgi:hypothetical protein